MSGFYKEISTAALINPGSELLQLEGVTCAVDSLDTSAGHSAWASLAHPDSPQTQVAQRALGGNESVWQPVGCSCQQVEITVFWQSASRALMVLIDTFSPRVSRAVEGIPTVQFWVGFFFSQEHNRNIQEPV